MEGIKMTIEKDMEKYDSSEGLKMRSDLAQLQATIARTQYELFCLNNYYKDQLDKYQVFIGVKKKGEENA